MTSVRGHNKAAISYLLNPSHIEPASEVEAATTVAHVPNVEALRPPPLSRKRSLPNMVDAQSGSPAKRFCPTSPKPPVALTVDKPNSANSANSANIAEFFLEGMVHAGFEKNEVSNVRNMLAKLDCAHPSVQGLLQAVCREGYSAASVKDLTYHLTVMCKFQDAFVKRTQLSGGQKPFEVKDLAITNLAGRALVGKYLECILKMTQVESLTIKRLQLSGQGPNFLHAWANLHSLTLNETELASLCFGSKPHMQWVNLNDNALQSVSFEGSTQVVSCALQRNKLQVFSCPENGLPKLELLRLDDNQLQDLPAELEHSPILVMSLAHNSFKAVPSVVTKLPRLRTLHMEGNPLEVLGPEVFAMPALRCFSARGCGLTVLPDVAKFANSLRTVDLSYNKLTQVPPDSWFTAGYATTIDLSGNPFSGEVIDAIVAKRKALMEEGRVLSSFNLPPRSYGTHF
jgi:Leucine-rich repeat (LRR) protein